MRRLRVTGPALALSALAFALCWLSFDLGHSWGDDFAEYIAQAMAVWDGGVAGQITANSFIVGHSPLGLGPIVYPWGFPLMLAPVYGAFGFSLPAFKLVGIACYALCVFALYLYFEKRLGGAWAAIAALLFAVNPALVAATNEVLSDIPFLLFSTLSLMAMEALLEGGAPRRQYAMGALSGLTALAAFTIRSNGLILMLALACAQALTLIGSPVARWFARGGARSVRPLPLAQALPYLIFAPCYVLLSVLLPGGGESHLSYRSLISLQSVWSNAIYYAGQFHSFTPVPVIEMPLYAIEIALCAFGAWKYARRHALAAIYLMGTLALYILWPARQGLRFLFPVLPAYALFMVLGARELAALIARSRTAAPDRAARLAALCLCAALCLMTVESAAGNLRRGRARDGGAFAGGALAAYGYIREHTPSDAVIAFEKPRALYLNAHRLGFALFEEARRLSGADYLLIAEDVNNRQITNRYTPAEIRELTGLTLEMEYQNESCTLYRVIPARGGA